MFLDEDPIFAGHIDINKLLDLLDIDYEQDGDELKSICPHPNHADNDPSWSINTNPEDVNFGKHHCFGCKFGGGIIKLVSGVLGVSHAAAADWLDSKFAFDIDDNQARDKICDIYLPKSKKNIDIATAKRIRKFIKSTEYVDDNDRFYRYLTSRNIPAWQIKRHRVKKIIDGYYSNRVLFALKNKNGKIISFYARSILKNIDKKMKGLYPRGKNIISQVLYGYEFINHNIDCVILHEGIPDMLSTERILPGLKAHGIGNPLAVMGGNLVDRQVSMISKFNTFYIFPDGDRGGDDFAAIAFKKLKNYGKVFIIKTPRGSDPDQISTDKVMSLFFSATIHGMSKRYSIKVDYNI